jgi:hypothetical protein
VYVALEETSVLSCDETCLDKTENGDEHHGFEIRLPLIAIKSSYSLIEFMGRAYELKCSDFNKENARNCCYLCHRRGLLVSLHTKMMYPQCDDVIISVGLAEGSFQQICVDGSHYDWRLLFEQGTPCWAFVWTLTSWSRLDLERVLGVTKL